MWVAPAGEPSSGQQLASSSAGWDGWGGLVWTPDKKLVYYSTTSGNSDFWLMQADGSHARQLTAGAGFKVRPFACPDGRTLVFESIAEGAHSIWRVDTDRGSLRRLTQSRAGAHPSCSPDSKWVVFDSVASGKSTLWKVAIEGGNPAQLTDYESSYPAISPDGKWIAGLHLPDPAQLDKQKIAIIPFEGGRPVKIVDFQRAMGPELVDSGIKWTPDGRAVAYLDARKGVSNIWSQPLDGGSAKPLTDFDRSSQVLSFAWSHDGKQLAMARGDLKSDVILIGSSK
jgi:TolB protein